MARKKLRNGTSAVVTILLKYLHPSKYIQEKYPNYTNKHKIEGSIVYLRAKAIVNRKKQMCIFVRHEDFE